MFRLLVLSTALAASATAQIVTDRPDLTESTESVAGVQLETGLLLEVNDTGSGGGSVDISGAQALIRVGVAPGLEVRLGLPDYQIVDVGGMGLDRFTPASIGAKAELGTVGSWSLAAIGEVSVPIEDEDDASPLAILIAGRDLEDASLGGQVEVMWDRATDRVEVGGTAVVGLSVSDRAGVFLEGAAASTPGAASILAQTGATYLLSDNAQLDAFVGAGLTETAPDVFGGIGFSARF